MTEIIYLLAGAVLLAGNIYSLRDVQTATGTDLYLLQTIGLEQNEKNMEIAGWIMLIATVVLFVLLLLPALTNPEQDRRGRVGRLMCIYAAFLTTLPAGTILHVIRMDFPGEALTLAPETWKADCMPLLSIGLPAGVLIYVLLREKYQVKQKSSLVLMGLGVMAVVAALFIPRVGDLVMFAGICIFSLGFYGITEKAGILFKKRPVLLHMMYGALGLAGILHIVVRLQVY